MLADTINLHPSETYQSAMYAMKVYERTRYVRIVRVLHTTPTYVTFAYVLEKSVWYTQDQNTYMDKLQGFKSKAQIRKFFDLQKQGKVGMETIVSWSMKTDHTNLPERVDSDNQ